MADREDLTPRVVEAVEAQLRRRVSPRVLRAAYRTGYRVLRPWWFVTRPHTFGIKVVVRCGEDVLLVKHTYARRGLWEELGIEPATITAIADVASRFDHKRERINVFAVDVAPGVAVTPSVAEIEAVCWARWDALPSPATAFTRRMVARAYWDEYR